MLGFTYTTLLNKRWPTLGPNSAGFGGQPGPTWVKFGRTRAKFGRTPGKFGEFRAGVARFRTKIDRVHSRSAQNRSIATGVEPTWASIGLHSQKLHGPRYRTLLRSVASALCACKVCSHGKAGNNDRWGRQVGCQKRVVTKRPPLDDHSSDNPLDDPIRP